MVLYAIKNLLPGLKEVVVKNVNASVKKKKGGKNAHDSLDFECYPFKTFRLINSKKSIKHITKQNATTILFI